MTLAPYEGGLWYFYGCGVNSLVDDTGLRRKTWATADEAKQAAKQILQGP